MRTVLSRTVASDPDLWVVGTATSGAEAPQVHNSGYSIAEPMDAVLELIGK